MSFLKTLVLATMASGLFASQAMATVVTNNDKRAYSVILDASTVPSDPDAPYFNGQYRIAAGKSLTLPCGKVCTIRLAGSDSSIKAADKNKAHIRTSKLKLVK